MTLDTAWFAAMEAHVSAIDSFEAAKAAHDADAGAHKAAQAAFPKGHPHRTATFAALNAAKTRMEEARAAIWTAESAVAVAEQALRDGGDYYAAAETYARETALPRALAAAEIAADANGELWLAAVAAVEKAAKAASLWRDLPALWAEAAPLSAARWAAGQRLNAAHAHAEWERRNQPTSTVGWLRG